MLTSTAAPSGSLTLTIDPIDRHRWPQKPAQFEQDSDLYITVKLWLRDRRLAIHADPFRRGVPRRNSHQSGPVAGWWRHRHEFPVPVPNAMIWLIDGHLTAEEATRLLEVIAVQAEIIMTELVDVPGRETPGRDWSVRAAAAVLAIDSYTSAYCCTPTVDDRDTEAHIKRAKDHGVIDLTEAFGTAPELRNPEWAVMTDAELDAEAAKLAERVPWKLQDRHEGMRYFVGVLRAMYRAREEMAGGLTPCNPSSWFATRLTHLVVVSDTSTDATLQTLAASEERAAATEGRKLLGGLPYLRAIRDGHRERIRQQLVDLGAEKSTNTLGHTTRAALLLRVDGWADPADGCEQDRTYKLAKLAGVSVEYVFALRERAFALNGAPRICE